MDALGFFLVVPPSRNDAGLVSWATFRGPEHIPIGDKVIGLVPHRNPIVTGAQNAVIANSESFVVLPVGSNQGLPVIECDCGEGGNVIEWGIVPDSVLLDYAKYETPQYDNLAAVLNNDASDTSGGPVAANKSKAPTADQAGTQSDANKRFGIHESKRGTIILNGEPSCAVGGWINLNGARVGVDGYYSIEQVEHEFTRASGFKTTIELKNIVSATAPTQNLPADQFSPPS